MLERGHETGVACCSNILENVSANAILITSDEAHFYLSGFVKKQSFPYWPEGNPRELRKRALHSDGVTVWGAVANFGVWIPCFFEE